MLFNSPEFILGLLPAALIGFFCLGRFGFHRAAILWLTVISLIFYGWWNVRYVPLLLSSIALNFITGEKLRAEKKGRVWIVIGITGNLLLLGYYKYAGFLTGVISDTTGFQVSIPTIVLPLAISFFTFQQIAYLVDCRAGLVKESNFLNYAAFITFFPHLIAGPITHHKEMIPQFASSSIFRPQAASIALGATIFFAGLFKKVIIADNLAFFANPVFEAAELHQPLTAIDSWIGAFTYTFQLYFDFSGYSDMAVGVGLLFGIHLPQNFASPLKASNIVEFWQRWHITLTRFITSYIYNPIVLNWSRKRARQKLPLLLHGRATPGAFFVLLVTPITISMLASGIWHGAGYQFVLWGALHSVYLILYHAWRELRAQFFPARQPKRSGKIIGIGITFLCVTASMVLFRSPNVTTAYNMFASMFGAHGIVVPQGLTHLPLVGNLISTLHLTVGKQMFNYSHPLIFIALIAPIVFAAPNIYEWMRGYETAIGTKSSNKPLVTSSRPMIAALAGISWQPSVGVSVALGFIAFVSLTKVMSGAPSEFIYFRF